MCGLLALSCFTNSPAFLTPQRIAIMCKRDRSCLSIPTALPVLQSQYLWSYSLSQSLTHSAVLVMTLVFRRQLWQIGFQPPVGRYTVHRAVELSSGRKGIRIRACSRAESVPEPSESAWGRNSGHQRAV